MRTRPLGVTGYQVSELGLGCAGFLARRAFSRSEAISLVREALDHGVTFFDTGAHYARGEAEERLGAAIRGRRDGLVIATKAGKRTGRRGQLVADFSFSHVRASVDQSLRRIGVERIDVLQLHGPKPADLTDQLLAGLADLSAAGKVGAWGVNAFSSALVDLVLSAAVLQVMMFDYNITCADRAHHIARLAAAGKGFLAATPLAQGHFDPAHLLPRRRADFWYLARAVAKRRALVRRAAKFRFVTEVPGWSGAQVALAWVLGNSYVASAVFGTTRHDHLVENLQTAGRALPPAIAARIDATRTRDG